MSDGGSRVLSIAAAGLFILAALSAAAILIEGPRIQADITARTTAALAPYRGITATISGRDVELGGAASDDAARAQAIAAVAALPGVGGVTDGLAGAAPADDGSGAPAPVSTYRFAAEWDGRTLHLRGYMPTRDAREETITHARDMLKSAEIDDALAVSAGPPDRNWQAIAAAGIAAMRTLATASLQMTGAAVHVSGKAKTDGDAAQAREILDSLPKPYTVTQDIAVDANAGPLGEAPYRFSAAYDGTSIALTGQVPSADVAAEIDALLKGALPNAALDARARPGGGAPNGAWPDAVELGLKAMGQTRAATLKVDGRVLAFEALAPDATARGRIIAAFADLPAGYTASLSIGSDKESAPLAQTVGGAGGQEDACQSQMSTAIAAAPIAFASNAAKLPDSAAPLLDKLTQIAATCPKARLQIAGHTDASGNAAANLKLSQGRADAVEAALILKGVDAKRVGAKGYGAARPIAANDTDDGKAKNRRIEVIVRP